MGDTMVTDIEYQPDEVCNGDGDAVQEISDDDTSTALNGKYWMTFDGKSKRRTTRSNRLSPPEEYKSPSVECKTGSSAAKSVTNQMELEQMLKALQIDDFFDTSEEVPIDFIDEEEIFRQYEALEGREHDYLGKKEIPFTAPKITKKDLKQLIPHKSLKEAPSLSLSPDSVFEERSYEDRFMAKSRVTLKIKKAVEKMPNTRAGRRTKKLVNHTFGNKRKAEVEILSRPISVRQELKTLFENGDVEWKFDDNQTVLAEQSLKKIKNEFPQWMFLLSEGFNIVLFGYGSKVPIFKELDAYLAKSDELCVMELDGLNPKLDAKETLNDFINDCLEVEIELKGGNFQSKVREMMANLRPLALHPHVILLVRNIERISTKNEQLFYLLASIATLPFVHMVASTDHCSSPLVFDQGTSTDVSLIWIKCNTYSPYVYESQYIGDACLGSEAFEEKAVKFTLEHVYGSVTKKAQQTFNILASLQIQAVKSKSFDLSTWNGLEFTELARICREKFVATSVTQLNNNLVEFIDNKIIFRTRSSCEPAAGSNRSNNRGGRTKSIENCLKINLDNAKLEEFILANPIQVD